MSDIIHLTNIQKYNDLIASSSKRRRNVRSDVANTALIGKFTLSKLVDQDEQTFIKYTCNLGRTIGAVYLSFGSNGCVFYINQTLTPFDAHYKDFIKNQITNYFTKVYIQQSEYDHFAKGYITKVVPSIASNFLHSAIQIDFSKIPEHKTTKTFTLVKVSLRTSHSWDDTFLCNDTERYGIYDVQSEKHLHTKKTDIIDFNYSLGLLSQSTRHPNPIEHINGVDVLVLLKDALQYVNTVKDEANRVWKKDSIACILNTFKKLRWPSHKAFVQNVANSVK